MIYRHNILVLLSDVKCTEAMVKVLVPQINKQYILLKDMILSGTHCIVVTECMNMHKLRLRMVWMHIGIVSVHLC